MEEREDASPKWLGLVAPGLVALLGAEASDPQWVEGCGWHLLHCAQARLLGILGEMLRTLGS